MNKGTAFERMLKRDLESLGYSVMRGAASKGSYFGMKVDLIVTKHTIENKKTAIVAIEGESAGMQLKVKGKSSGKY